MTTVHCAILDEQGRKCQRCSVLKMEAAFLYQVLVNNYGTCYHTLKYHSGY